MAYPQASRFAQFLRRMFSIRETMADVNVLQDFFPTVELAGDIVPDQLRQRGERLWSSGVIQTAGGAGQFSRIFFGNLPPNTISVIRHIVVTAGAPANLQVSPSVITPAGGFTPVVLADLREPGTLPSAATQQGKDTAVGAVVPFYASIPLNVSAVIIQNVNWIMTDKSVDGVTAPRNIVFGLDTANLNLTVTAFGYERFIEPSEVRA